MRRTSGISPAHRGRRLLRIAAALAASTSALALLPALTAHGDALSSARAEAAAITAKLAQLNQQEDAADERYDQDQIALSAAEAQVASAKAAEARARAELAARRRILTAAAVDDYMSGGQVGTLQVLAQSSQAEFGVKQSYLDSVVNGEQNAVDGYRQAETALAHQEAVVAQAAQVDNQDVTEAGSLRDQLAGMVGTEQTTLDQVQGRVAALVAADQAAAAAAAAARAQAQAEAAAAAAQAQQAAQGASSASGLGGGGPGDGLGGAIAPPPTGSAQQIAVQVAESELGKPYVYGGAGPDDFDCSGLVQYAYAQAGIDLPHSAADQWDDTTRVSYSQLEPGDLVFFYQPVDHVGIYVGNGEMIDAPHTGANVEYDSIWWSGLDGFGRVSG